MINEHRLVELFLSLVKIDSPSFCEKKVADFLCSWAETNGYSFHVDNAGAACGGDSGNVIITVPATGKGHCPAFSAHMDCVAPCLGVKPIVDGKFIRSAGDTVLGGDDKGGIAAILEAVISIEESSIPHPEISLLFTIVEESGMYGAKAFDPTLINSKSIVVLDAEGNVGTLINRSPGKYHIDIDFIGKAAHAGMVPESGISAIQLAAEAITRMPLLRVDEESTANIGTISGGVATNIVANQVTLSAEARSMNTKKLSVQLEKMEKACSEACSLVGGSYRFDAKLSYPAVNRPETDLLIQEVVESCKKCEIEPSITSTGGGSDANIFDGKGLSVVTLGIGMTDVHTVNEYISIQSLVDSAKLVAEIMKS